MELIRQNLTMVLAAIAGVLQSNEVAPVLALECSAARLPRAANKYVHTVAMTRSSRNVTGLFPPSPSQSRVPVQQPEDKSMA